MVLLIGFMYVVLILPRRRQMARQRALISSIAAGDEIVTIGGIHGTVVDADGPVLVVAVAPGVEMRFLRDAISRRVPQPSSDADLTDGNDSNDHGHDSGDNR